MTDDERIILCRQEIIEAINKASLPASVLCLILENVMAQIKLQEINNGHPH